MVENKEQEMIAVDSIVNVLAEAGYNTSDGGEGCLMVKDPESGLTFTCVLENNILFSTVACVELEESVLSKEFLWKLLDSENGISTSNFQLYKTGKGKIVVTLNNFCKLLDLGLEDRDDILSCLEFLNMDVLAARQLLADSL